MKRELLGDRSIQRAASPRSGGGAGRDAIRRPAFGVDRGSEAVAEAAGVVQRAASQRIADSRRARDAGALQARIDAGGVAQRVAAGGRDGAQSEARGAGQGGLPMRLRQGIEQLSGMDMSGVRVHRDSPRPRRMQALAYTQGDEIHLGPGQERHLPHEAWHVVQQRQGRVRPTLQMKGGVQVNDDGALEREADVMGSRALSAADGGARSGVFTPRSHAPASGVVQRMAASQDANSGGVYNVSMGRKLVCGLDYPNHELYVRDRKMLGDLNAKLAGRLKFVSRAARDFDFGGGDVRYYEVYPQYKSDKERNELNAKALLETAALAQTEHEKDQPGSDFEVTQVHRDIAELNRHMDTLRKVILQWDHQDGADDESVRALKQAYIAVWNELGDFLNGASVQEKALSTLEGFVETLEDYAPSIYGNARFLLPKMKQHTKRALKLLGGIEASTPLMRRIGHYADQVAATRRQGDSLLLPRGCDLVSGTVLGKLTDQDTEDVFAMNFTLNMGNLAFIGNEELGAAHHYATKILADGLDFVTIEGFAKKGYFVADNSWEFFMHGGREDEVTSFGDYTASRYGFFKALFGKEMKTVTGKLGPMANVNNANNFHKLLMGD